jgi:rhodanese-related sulfurtransferase
VDNILRPVDDLSVQIDTSKRTLDELLAAATRVIVRYEPTEALAAVEHGALLIDIRSDVDRERDGIIPGSLHIPRTVLEWRLDRGSPHCNPHLGPEGRQVVLLCDHGCSSIFAAATLTSLGYTGAGDVIGGFAAWREAGLPTTSATPYRREPGEPAGMRPPDAA